MDNFFLRLLSITFLFTIQETKSYSQKSVSGTFLITPRSTYFIPNQYIKNNPVLLLKILQDDTVLATSFGGHLVSYLYYRGDSISIKYADVEEDTTLLGDYILYYGCACINFYKDHDSTLFSDAMVRKHEIYVDGKKVVIRNRFTYKGRRLKFIDCPSNATTP